MYVTCPECGFEEAYHNGCEYECPNCDYTWSDDDDDDDDDDLVDHPERFFPNFF